MEHRSYPGVTRADINRIRDGIGKYGITIPEGDDVEVNGPLGIKMQMTYSEPDQTLQLAITKKPGYISQNQIWKVIEMTAGKARN